MNTVTVLILKKVEKRYFFEKEYRRGIVMLFFGFAIADSMFTGDVNIERCSITVEDVKKLIDAGDVVACINPSHKATIDAMTSRFGIEMEIPNTPPKVQLHAGDEIIVMGVRGLPRLEDRHEYTAEEIEKATFQFAKYTVHSV